MLFSIHVWLCAAQGSLRSGCCCCPAASLNIYRNERGGGDPLALEAISFFGVVVCLCAAYSFYLGLSVFVGSPLIPNRLSSYLFFFPSSSSKKETERRRGENFWWTRDPRLSIRQWQIPLDGSDTHAVKIYKGKDQEENNQQIRLSSSSSIYPPMCKLNQRQKKNTSKFSNYYCN